VRLVIRVGICASSLPGFLRRSFIFVPAGAVVHARLLPQPSFISRSLGHSITIHLVTRLLDRWSGTRSVDLLDGSTSP
jgi:hypothetical protein